MSSEFVEQFCHKHFRRYPKKSKEEIIKKLTHLFLNGRKLEKIGNLSPCKRLRVIYLHSNSIHRIENLDGLSQLTHLYLQWNRIRKIENLNGLKQLQKLYLSYNEINRLEGIFELNQLEELHLERQKLLPGEEFSFDLDCFCGISTSLRVLNLSGLGLTNLTFLKQLKSVQKLIAVENQFACADEVAACIGHLTNLRELKVKGCPAQRKDFYYRNKITIGSDSLEILDDKPIEFITRKFLKSFEKFKSERKTAAAPNRDEINGGHTVEIDLRKDLSPSNFEGQFNLSNIIAEAMAESEYKPWGLEKFEDDNEYLQLTPTPNMILEKDVIDDHINNENDNKMAGN